MSTDVSTTITPIRAGSAGPRSTGCGCARRTRRRRRCRRGRPMRPGWPPARPTSAPGRGGTFVDGLADQLADRAAAVLGLALEPPVLVLLEQHLRAMHDVSLHRLGSGTTRSMATVEVERDRPSRPTPPPGGPSSPGPPAGDRAPGGRDRPVRRPPAGGGDATWVGYAEAMVEAAMVGGLADWFAVVALFRHPLGLPIPYTAVIPTRKDQFGETLGDFVQTSFLTPTSSPSGSAPPGSSPPGGLAGRARQRRAAGTPPGRGHRHRRRPAARRRGPPRAGGGGPAPHRDHAPGAPGGQGPGGHDRQPPPRAAGRDAAGARPVPHRQPGQPPRAVRGRVPVVAARGRGGPHLRAPARRGPPRAGRRGPQPAPRAAPGLRRQGAPAGHGPPAPSPAMRARGEELKHELLAQPELRGLGRRRGPTSRPAAGPGRRPRSELRRRLAETLVALGRRLVDDPTLAARVEEGRRPGSATWPSSSATRSPPWSAGRWPAGTAARPPTAWSCCSARPPVHPHQRHGVGKLAGLVIHAAGHVL